MKQLYQGKAKIVYEKSPQEVVIHFTDGATAGNGAKKATIEGKGVLNSRISNLLFEYLGENGVVTHFIKQLNDRDTLCRKVTIIPLEVIVRNIASGSIVRRLGIEKGTVFDQPTVEFSYKNDDLGDPLLNDDHAVALKIATREELDHIKREALKINDLLKSRFYSIAMTLVDFKLEFGKDDEGVIRLADEISPDNCRLWNNENISFDKDLFREDSGDLIEGYEAVYHLLEETS
ncbi:MAG: phosphoribosylaminoimidazolesuccinocarboxamide synthase [Sphaerochaetaceae bacterium]|nr:phosphoribosylaminoimidazolesuccinocarboxamide synthase [Sphaerochaetaceae bacterium]